MWIFTVRSQPSGYAYSSHTIFRVNAGDKSGDLALKKLYKVLIAKRYISSKLSEEDFMNEFDEDWSATFPNGPEVHTVHPDDDNWIP